MENMNKKVERMVRGSAKRRLWKRFVAIPAAVVVFVTTYALILPAIAMEGDTYCGFEAHQHTDECYVSELACGYEDGAVVQDVETWMELACAATVHQHTEDCYDESGNVICGYADYLIHEHNADCYAADGSLVCPLPEVKAHVHDENCYVEETVNVCGLPEGEGHTHSESCYTLVSHPELVCGQTESEGHVHNESCYTTFENTYLACGLEEQEGHTHSESCYTTVVAEDGTETVELTCTIPETPGHVHTEACYITEPVTELTCTIPESAGHAHTDACWANVETMELTCGLPETPGHQHTDACFATEKRLVCTEPEVIPHIHGDDCYTVTDIAEDGTEIKELTCGMQQLETHVHTADCFATYENIVERPHQHTDLCYIQVLTCTLPEHEHVQACYEEPEPEATAEPEVSAEPIEGEAAEPEATAEPVEGEVAEPEVSAEPIEGEVAEPEATAEPTEGEVAEPEATAEPVEGQVEEPETSAEPEVIEEPAEPEYICGKEEHIHDENCYTVTVAEDGTETTELTCGIEEHTHDETCLAEVEIIEDDMAPAAPEYVCGKEEHTHDENCYTVTVAEDGTETTELTCGLEEHTHDETCLAEVEIIEDDMAPAEPEYICGKEEHIHDENCYTVTVAEDGTEVRELTCGLEEHTHDESCLAVVDIEGDATPLLDRLVLICDKEEHIHGPECMNESLEYICGKEAHEHTAACYATVSDEGKIVYCGIAEHTHDENCYNANGELICGLPEHTHNELCYLPPEAAELKLAASRQVKTFENDDVLVTVVYGPEADIPEAAELFVYQVTEESSPEHYAQRIAETKAMLMPEDIPAEADLAEEETAEDLPILIYNIGFYMNGVEVEPKAPVTVTVHILGENHLPTGESYAVIHFAQSGTEVLENTMDEAGATTFVTESFSDFGVAMSDAETGADTEPLPEPETQNDEPIVDEPQSNEPVVDESQSNEPVVDEPQDSETVADEPEATELPIIASGPAMNQSTAEAMGAGTEVGIAPMALVNGSNAYVRFDGTLGGTKYYGNNASDTSQSVNRGFTWNNRNEGSFTMPRVSGSVSNFEPWGWYPVDYKDNESIDENVYYLANTSQQLATRSYSNRQYIYTVPRQVFYADWWPMTYNFATSGMDSSTPNNQVPDTSSFVTNELWDFNETINRHYADVVGDVHNNDNNAPSHDETWTASGFAFTNPRIGYTGYDPGEIGNPGGATGCVSADELSYLFDDNARKSDGKGINYVGTAGYLYQFQESTGYYYYDSTKNAAGYNQNNHRFYLASGAKSAGGNSGQFLPFNGSGAAGGEGSYSGVINYWFGMKSTITFNLDEGWGGDNVNINNNSQAKQFRVSSTDDVIVLLDGQPVLCLTGGNHYGEINFSTGKVKTGTSTVRGEGMDVIGAGSDFIETDLLAGLNRAGGHTLTVYYVEHDAGDCQYAVYFNLPDVKGGDLPSGGGQNTGSGSVVGTKTIDYLADNVDTYDFPTGADPQPADLRELYRLHLTASNDRSANPINVLFIVDHSGSMGDKENGNDISNYNKSKMKKVNDGLMEYIQTLLPSSNTAQGNYVAVVEFARHARTLMGWKWSQSEANRFAPWNHQTRQGGTNYSCALDEAKALLETIPVAAKNNPTYIFFISDGVPTYYETFQNCSTNDDENAHRSGTPRTDVSGGDGQEDDDNDSLRAVYGPTQNSIYAFQQWCNSNLGEHYLYSIAYGTTEYFSKTFDNGNHTYADQLVTLGEDGVLYATSGDNVSEFVRNMLALTPVYNLSISDTLSQYVQFAGAAGTPDPVTDVQVTMKVGGQETVVWKNGTPTQEGYSGINPYVKSVTIDGNRITVQFQENAEVKSGTMFELSFNVRLSDTAYYEYATNGKFNATGDADKTETYRSESTNYKGNYTSAGMPGFFSNSSASTFSYVQGGTPKTEAYDKPVVQVWRPELTVTKLGPKGVDGEQEPLSGATFTLRKDGEDSSKDRTFTTGADGKVTIDKLVDGTYKLWESVAPGEYQLEKQPVVFTVKKGLITEMRLDGETDTTTNWALGETENKFGEWSWNGYDVNPHYQNGRWVFDYRISLTDQPDNIKLQIKKVQEGDTTKPVEGAKFTLWKDVKPEDAAESYKPTVDAGDVKLKELISDEHGILKTTDETPLAFVELETGIYLLEETEAPAGFNKLEEPIIIYVTHDKDGFHVSYSGPHINEAGNGTPEAAKWTNDYWQMTIYNTYGYELPETGGEGTMVYTLGGIALLALAGAMFCERRRRTSRG